jgi:hypothetical protein
MEAKRQMEIDGGGIADGKGIVPVELHGAINSPLVSGGLVSAVSGST